jgi:hypothetical protein
MIRLEKSTLLWNHLIEERVRFFLNKFFNSFSKESFLEIFKKNLSLSVFLFICVKKIIGILVGLVWVSGVGS